MQYDASTGDVRNCNEFTTLQRDKHPRSRVANAKDAMYYGGDPFECDPRTIPRLDDSGRESCPHLIRGSVRTGDFCEHIIPQYAVADLHTDGCTLWQRQKSPYWQ